MKAFFQNRVVAIVLTAAVVLGCLVYGWTQRPATVPSPAQGDWVYDGAVLLERLRHRVDGLACLRN